MPPKRRRRFQGLYYHSSPPKVMPMNGQTANQNGRKRRDTDDFSVKLSTIRIWMHEKEIGKLTRILWAGQGHRLCQQASNNGRVKRFLAAVPHVMNAIKDLHQAVIDNNLETLQMKLEPPVPPALVTSRDANALNVIHKAAGLGHAKILEYLVSIWPEGAHETDITGKTPLHWAASAKNNMRCYTLLTQAGCNEEAQDYKMKTPSYYRHKPHEIERAFLVFVPEAPRVPPDSTTDWEALSDDNESNGGGDSKKLDIKIPPAPLNELNGDGAETTSEPDTNDGTSANGEEDSSKTEAEPITEPTPAVEGDGDDPLNNNENGIEKGNEKGNENGAENITRTLSADEAPAVEEDEVKADADPEPEPDPGPEPQEEGEENGTHSNDEKQETEANVEQENETTGAEVQNGEVEQNDQEENETEKTEAPTKLEENENAHESSENENVETASNNGKDAPAGDDEEDDDEDVVAPSQGGQQASLELEPGVQQELQQMEQPYEQDGTDSPTSSLAIEGFVQGASDDYTVQSQTAAYEVDEDTRIQQIIASGDLEQLAQIVLNGDGGRLLGLQTKEPEVQAFLNNVPSYMEKIRRVHDAAREGGLSALQQALDRRKFAIAKDDISPNGSTPLHVAVLFGHSDIVRYLASRFPETMDATDNDGRTPIHYAATIKDNGHFYNVLMQLGANTKVVDKLGHTPEFYLDVEKSKEILTYTKLLNIYGAEELENQLLSDQGICSVKVVLNCQWSPSYGTVTTL
ncbi:uncharacterized protein LOC115634764 [Scaptodrosophila lebanonensis]|uniref:Uncharacterized protein LOC115634764 n=1 Tax=Drosophila lebanonensis TaxID=7225 RepID=A0A6J2UJW6_DROLE|nr:uncharacterized protein LOC115634764 [Scaptodrosophila lebanonensis]